MLLVSAAPAAQVELVVSGQRSTRGLLQICLTRDPKHFPDCAGDRSAITRTVPATQSHVVFEGVAPGDYAVSLIHDENGNGKLDTLLGIPREGFGFSRNPPIRFGPPSFASARFAVGTDPVTQGIKLKYLL